MIATQVKPRPALTERQQQIYDFIRGLILNRGYGPTYREIGRHFGIRSPNGVKCHLDALEHKGLIRRAKVDSRSITLTDRCRDDAERELVEKARAILAGVQPGNPMETVLLRELAEALEPFGGVEHE